MLEELQRSRAECEHRWADHVGPWPSPTATMTTMWPGQSPRLGTWRPPRCPRLTLTNGAGLAEVGVYRWTLSDASAEGFAVHSRLRRSRLGPMVMLAARRAQPGRRVERPRSARQTRCNSLRSGNHGLNPHGAGDPLKELLVQVLEAPNRDVDVELALPPLVSRAPIRARFAGSRSRKARPAASDRVTGSTNPVTPSSTISECRRRVSPLRACRPPCTPLAPAARLPVRAQVPTSILWRDRDVEPQAQEVTITLTPSSRLSACSSSTMPCVASARRRSAPAGEGSSGPALPWRGSARREPSQGAGSR